MPIVEKVTNPIKPVFYKYHKENISILHFTINLFNSNEAMSVFSNKYHLKKSLIIFSEGMSQYLDFRIVNCQGLKESVIQAK